MVITGNDGQLLAYGRGQPHWCRTAAAAEAWALCTVVTQSPLLPSMRTDCQALITTAAAGIRTATEPRKALARMWILICNALDGEIQQLGDNSSLIWMPAHTALHSIGVALDSQGAPITALIWRANHIVDALVKKVAGHDRWP